MRYSTIAILVAAMLVSGTALAGAQRQQNEGNRARVAELERRSEALNRQMGPGKLGATERDELAKQQREIRRMIHQLETGGAVEPSEIERMR